MNGTRQISVTVSPPCGWCGLKLYAFPKPYYHRCVTTLRVVWIEISVIPALFISLFVTTLRVVWIEIQRPLASRVHQPSPPCGWCGLKSIQSQIQTGLHSSPPCGWCGLNSQEQLSYYAVPGHHLAGGVLRGNILLRLGYLCKSPKYIAITFFVGNTMGEFIEKSMI